MADQPTPPTPLPGADAEQRLDLALRLLAMSHHCDSDLFSLSPGALPRDLPFELPLPDDARMLGALSVGQPNLPDHQPPLAIILVEMPHTVEQSAQRLSAALEAQGWSQNAMPHNMRGGFAHVMPNYNYMSFRSAASDYVLTILPQPSASASPTTFSISVQREPTQAQRRPDPFHDQRELIPALLPPVGATQQSGGGGGGNRSRYTSASLTTSAPIAEVMATYDRQLERGGWRRRSGGVSGSVGWSYWSFSDDEQKAWRGALAVLGDPERPRDYLALIQIDSDSRDDGGFAGWKSHSIIGG
jgi:hypothetical protein